MRNVVFLDLDETLIYFFSKSVDYDKLVRMTLRRIEEADANRERVLRATLNGYLRTRDGYNAAIPFDEHGSRVGVRPGARKAIIEFRQFAEVCVFTAADPKYARDALRVSGLLPLVSEIYSLRQPNIESDLSWASDSNWVLLDDTSAIEKVEVLGGEERRLIQVEPFRNGWLATKPLTQYVEPVKRVLGVRENRRQTQRRSYNIDPLDIQDTSPHLYRVLRGHGSLE